MAKPESASRASNLASARPGTTVRVLSVAAASAGILAGQGVYPGAVIIVEGDAPFRGPRLVRLGRVRLALGRQLAGQILVEPGEPDADP